MRPTTTFWLAAVLAATMAPGAGQQPNPWEGPLEPGQMPPNILLIILDDIGIDKLSFYGQTPEVTATPPQLCPGTVLPPSCPPLTDIRYPTTCTLDSLRKEGMLFRNAYANPLCSPTRACLLTGRYAFRTGIGNVTSGKGLLPSYSSVSLGYSEVLLPELLRDGFVPIISTIPPISYRSGAFGKWHLANKDDDNDATHVIASGFDYFSGSMQNVDAQNTNAATPHEKHYLNWTKHTQDHLTGPSEPVVEDRWHGTVTSLEAKAWINEGADPFFAYVCFNEPHEPLQLPPEGLVTGETKKAVLCALSIPNGPWPTGVFADAYTSPVSKVSVRAGDVARGTEATPAIRFFWHGPEAWSDGECSGQRGALRAAADGAGIKRA